MLVLHYFDTFKGKKISLINCTQDWFLTLGTVASEVTRQTETEIISSEYESEVTEESSSESEEETTTTETEYETPRGKSYFLSPSFFIFFFKSCLLNK